MLFSWWSLSSSSLSSSSSSPPWQQEQQRQLDNHRHIVDDDDKDNDNDDDDDSYWMYQHHDYNQTFITSTVTIRVTPRQDFLVSWACLSLFLLVSIGVATWQVYKERNIDQRSIVSSSSPTNMTTTAAATTTTTTLDGTSSGSSSALTGGGNHHHYNSNNNKHRLVESSSSTAEVTRCVFRRLLLFAMLSRFICIPVMIWSDPVWCQFVGDTLPEMIFATAWTLLVTFFVQVVGIATGQGTNTTPSIVIQLTAYIVYLGLILLELVNSVASVLLYALLCCIYAALLGTIAYFLPRLLSLLTPIVHEPLLAWRLILCTVICTMLFCAHMIGFARIVVDPPQKVYWWWKYGCLEVVPAVLFLILLRPSVHHKDRVSSSNGGVGSGGGNFATDGSGGGGGGGGDWKRAPVPAGLIRTDSIESNHSNSPHHNNHHQHKQQQTHGVPVVVGATAKPHYHESTALSKSPPQQQQQQHVSYGATNV